MSQKTVVAVDLSFCSKCRKKVMELISTIEGVNSIVLDPSKNTVTVIGDADPMKIVEKVRKYRKSAPIVSVGPAKEEKKEKDGKKKGDKDTTKQKGAVTPNISLTTCQKCNDCYVIRDDYYSYCSIL